MAHLEFPTHVEVLTPGRLYFYRGNLIHPPAQRVDAALEARAHVALLNINNLTGRTLLSARAVPVDVQPQQLVSALYKASVMPNQPDVDQMSHVQHLFNSKL